MNSYYRTANGKGKSSTNACLLKPGHNVWQLAHAKRFSMLVDADAYFGALRESLRKARHSLFILTWDIDSRLKLVPSGANDGYPEALGDFLHAIVSERPDLHAYVLNWDFTMLYAMEREWLPAVKLGWRTHRRLSFRLDGAHPVGSCHHQKIVVIDDDLAFVGGLDLTRSRWDTPEHCTPDPRRLNSDGTSYAAFHDVQAMVEGDAARALGELCRERWHQATGTHAVPSRAGNITADCWPRSLHADLENTPVGIARTRPAYLEQPGCSELLQLHLDIIQSARDYLYIENQYFTSGLLGDAFARRLADTAGPDLVVVSPERQSGWLEEATMGVLRSRLHARLRSIDSGLHYRLLCPQVPGLKDACLNVHSKVLFMDGRLMLIGSANLSNRSMVCDTECSLCIEACGSITDTQRVRTAILRMHARLLAEHLGQTDEKILDAMSRHQRLLPAIDALSDCARRLVAFEPTAMPEIDALIPRQALFDPEKPIAPEALLAELLPREAREPLHRRLWALMLLAIFLLTLALAWRFSALRDYLNLSSLLAIAQQVNELPFTPLLVMLAYMVGSLLMVPVTLMIAATGVVFGVIPGAPYALCGSLLGALAGYGLGKYLGKDAVTQLAGPRVSRLSQRIAKRGILAIMIVRLLPLAPFGVVNLIAGISPIRLRDYAIGTVLGLLPGVLLTTTFAHHLLLAIRQPSQRVLGILIIVILLLAGFAVLVRKLVSRRLYRDTE